MQNSFHPRTVFILGLISLSIVVSLVIIIGDAFDGSLWTKFGFVEDKAIKEQVSTGGQIEDPLITVVPKDVRAGYPQPLPTDPKRGAENPEVVIVQFSDFQCEGCAEMDEAIRQILVEYPHTVQHVWKDFPLPTVHPYAEGAAIAARCADKQGKFWDMHDVLFENQKMLGFTPYAEFASQIGINTDQFSACITSSDAKALVVQGYMIARSFNLTQTPTLFVNKTPIEGKKTVEELRVIIDEALKE